MTLAFQAEAAEFFGWLRTYLTSTFNWFFLLSANIFLVFSPFLVLPPLGSVRPGAPGAKRAYPYIPCFPMCFPPGRGIVGRSVVWGKRVQVGVDLVGRVFIKKKQKTKHTK